jgi:hypothetical protein
LIAGRVGTETPTFPGNRFWRDDMIRGFFACSSAHFQLPITAEIRET